jgi:6-phosphogluconolactonase
VTAVAIDAPDKLRVLNRQPNKGSAPCHLTTAGNYLLSANYGSGDLAVHPLLPDGSLGQQTDLVEHEGATPHAHQVLQVGEYIVAVDLGTDSIYTYTFADGKLTLRYQTTLKAGAGPATSPSTRPAASRTSPTNSTARSPSAGTTTGSSPH